MDENQMNQRDPMANQIASQPSAPAPAPTPAPMSHKSMGPSGMGMNKNMILGIIAAVAVLLVIILAVVKLGLFGMSNEALGKKAVDYINTNGLAGQGQTAILESISEESGLVKVKLKIGATSFDSYITKDGKLLFPQAIVLSGATGGTDTTTPPAQTGTEPADASKVNIAGSPFIGNANAPATMVLWTDFQCSYCKKMEQETLPQIIKDYVDTGKLKIVFKEYAFLSADSTVLANWSLAVWEAAPSKYYAWHKAVYDAQGQNPAGWAAGTKIVELTTSAIGAADAQKAAALMQSKVVEYQAIADADKAEGVKFGVTGTPGSIIGTKFISGADSYANFKAAIDAAVIAGSAK